MTRRRIVAFLALISLAALGQPNPWARRGDPKVSIREDGVSVETVMKKLSASYGERLVVHPEVAADVLVLNTRQVPLSELLAKVAQVTSAKWEARSDGLHLLPDRDVERNKERALLRSRVELVRVALQKMTESPEYRLAWSEKTAQKLAEDTLRLTHPAGLPKDPDETEFDVLGPRSPINRAIVRILSTIGPEEVAAAIARRHLTYGLVPTPMQKSLPMSANGILTQFLSEQSMFVDATNEAALRGHYSGSVVTSGTISLGNFLGGNPRLGVGQAILALDGNFVAGYFTAILTVADRNGKVLKNGVLVGHFPQAAPKSFPAEGDDSPLTPTPLTQEAKAVDAFFGGGGTLTSGFRTDDGWHEFVIPGDEPPRRDPPSRALLAVLLHPDEVDPISIGAGKVLNEIADRRKVNLVCNAHDSLFALEKNSVGLDTTPSRFLSSAALQHYQDIEISNGWLTMEPVDLASLRGNRVDRAGLARMAQSLYKHQILMLDDMAAYAVMQHKPVRANDIDGTYLRLVQPDALNDARLPSWSSYRLYGALSKAQRDALSRGQRIFAGTFTPVGRQALFEIVFEEGQNPILTDPDGKEMDALSSGRILDWTQLAPNGVTDTTSMSSSLNEEPGAYAHSTETGRSKIVSAANLATLRYVHENPNLSSSHKVANYTLFSPAKMRVLRMSIAYAPDVSVHLELRDAIFDDSQALVSYDRLPSSFLDRVDRELALYREAFRNERFGSEKSSPPPP